MTEHYRKLITRSALFEKVSLDGMARLLEACPLKDLMRSEALLRPGQRNDKLYLILSGALNIHLSDTHAAPFLTLGAGECVGEISILTETTTTASVIAEEDSVLLVIKQSTLWSMTRISHGLARNLLKILAQRLRYNNRVIAEAAG
ncbi:MAG: cyclic nucleotide-binding domain-containing protein [Gammaproteobacteria bacterium]|nr:cyclic nucleotide-binding domain-containing protein [Gammaproteobacteria bacterium]